MHISARNRRKRRDFQLLDAVRRRSLPVEDLAKLASIEIEGGNHFGITGASNQLSYAIWREIERH